jgi:hypothetical protein
MVQPMPGTVLEHRAERNKRRVNCVSRTSWKMRSYAILPCLERQVELSLLFRPDQAVWPF